MPRQSPTARDRPILPPFTQPLAHIVIPDGSEGPGRTRNDPMPDLIYLAAFAVLLLATLGLIALCDRLAPREVRSHK